MRRGLPGYSLPNWITRTIPKLWQDNKRQRLEARLHEVESEIQWIVRMEVEDAAR